MSATNIVLIGFMGSGKSSVAKALAEKTPYYFLDTDAMIESSQGKDISDIFKDEGEAHFRRLEEDTAQWLQDNVSNAVISTGGGMLVYSEALKEVGKVVYLKLPFSSIMARMSDDELKKRPLFHNKEKAEAMYNERDSIYEQKADIVIDADKPLFDVLRSLEKAI